MPDILVVDDEKEICHFLSHLLSDKGYSVNVCTSGKEFDRLIVDRAFDLAFLDVRLPDRNGLQILQSLKETQPLCKVIVMTGYGTVKTAVEAIKLGADDFIEKPFDHIEDIENLADQLLGNGPAPAVNCVHELASRLDCFIGKNEEMNQLYTLAYKFAQKNVTVLIQGETGTGKEVLAHYIHQASLRRDSPYMAVNCGAISENLLESELFGHTKGAFTGAARERKGYFELAGKGTLFLDEIGEASLATQVKLLRVLETGEYIKVGGEHTERSKARLIAASHVDLQQAVARGTFREDLLYRLDVVKLTIPPLRKRLEDIPNFIDFYMEKQGLKLTFTQETLNYLQHYNWPGNVRELVNVIKRAAALAEGETSVITPEFLPAKLTAATSKQETAATVDTSDIKLGFEEYLKKWQLEMLEMWKKEETFGLHKVLAMMKSLETETTNTFIQKALKKTIGNRAEAARLLGITDRKLRYLLNEKNKKQVE
ncbi:sigma-54 dependent transcriptional regulator [Neobacillus sp. OS1-32]|uniref:sigma-54-dependent transcriptional regulator n=1 Tax=Neobacillus sp. OS1-32 TaxID=3070682 RepID=UPI0027E14426|nr:sigma-54 dependent transcriptional regulator [Neobacillus sp. OS1-32]WML28608.1 sigma-54 dependent transcriptional regulator [Neobacillus sp. OS1-32]